MWGPRKGHLLWGECRSCRRVAADDPPAVEEGGGRKGPGTGQGA